MIESRYLCPLCSEKIETTDPNFAKDKLWVRRAVSFMETHKGHSQTIKTALNKYYEEKEALKNENKKS